MTASSTIGRHKRAYRWLTGAILAMAVFAAWSQAGNLYPAQSQLPTIGDPADRHLSPAQETKLGKEFLRNVYRSGAVLQDPEVSAYIQHLGTVLVNSLGDSQNQYTFFVVNDNGINAFAVPGGFVGVNSGLILTSDTESELASVLSHEIAHVSQRHIARRLASMADNSLPTLGAMLAGILLADRGSTDDGSALVYAGAAAQQQQMINFTRSNEIEADRIGLDILHRSGFDPRGMAAFFRTLQRQRFGKIDEDFRFLMTHPLDNVRISEARARIEKLPANNHRSSDHYRYAKARLQAVTHHEPSQLVRDIRKDIEQLERNTPLMQYAYSQALEVNGDYKRAAGVLENLVQEDSENTAFQLGLARARMKSGQVEPAVDILESMLSIYPDDYAVNYYYATALKQADRPEAGRKRLKKYLAGNRAVTLDAYKLLAELHEHDGQQVEAKKLLAEYYFKMGNYHAATFQLKDALRNPDIDVVTRSRLEKRLKDILEATQS
jgi:predicted Zn-dependent protease